MNAESKLFELGYDFSHIVPIPADLSCTTTVEAGAVSLGVEYRSLDESTPVVMVEADGSTSTKTSEVTDSGVSLHVFDTATGDERLRFDAFDDDPHYHYLNPGTLNRLVVFDRAANGDMIDWAMAAIRYRLRDMLVLAEAGELADQVDDAKTAAALDEVAKLVEVHLGPRPQPAQAR